MSHDLQLDLDVLLPDAHGTRDRCVQDLLGAMRATPGVADAHLEEPADAAARVCLHVGEGSVSLQRLAEKATATGAAITERYGHALWQVSGVRRTGQAETAAARLRALPGVLDAAVAASGSAVIDFDRTLTSEPELLAAARGAGLRVAGASVGDEQGSHDHDGGHDGGASADQHDHDHAAGSRGELVVAVVSLVVYLAARVTEWVEPEAWFIVPGYVLAALATGIGVLREAVATLRTKRVDIDLLMVVAAIGAAAVGSWGDAALLLVLFSLGHALEGFAMRRARREISSLADLAPASATRRDGAGDLQEVPVADLAPGDVVVVRPHERFPADGVVVLGTTSVDEAPVTGESLPVEKVPYDGDRAALLGRARSGLTDAEIAALPRQSRVFAGTLNGDRSIELVLVAAASDSTLARVVRLVAEAEAQVSPTQRATQRIVQIFVPAVLALVAVLLIAPPLLGEPFRESFLRAMAVLVAASPCALAIATPSAVLAAIGRAARDGVLVQGGGPLEALARVDVVALDKTGTLTLGQPRLVAVAPIDGVSEAELLTAALALERVSGHPLARAIADGARERLALAFEPEASDVVAVPGQGVRGLLNGEEVRLGSGALMAEVAAACEDLRARLEATGATTASVSLGGRALGVLGVMDTPRPEAAETVAQLRALGIRQVVMLSGDTTTVARSVGALVGIDDVRGSLLPQDKVTAVRELSAQGRGGGRGGVAMVGDGVNDAPALATADVGIAMGAAGSAVALETADIALMADRIDRLPFAVGLARRASRVVRQNLFFSLGVVVVLIPLAILGLGIGPAVIAHEGSTLVVVANALLLLGYDRRKQR